MLSDISIDQDAVLVSQNHIVLSDFAVESRVHEVEPVVQIFNEEFVLASGGMYSNGNGLIGAVPTWILDAIREQLTTGSGNLTQVLYDLQAVMSSFQIGITQAIASLNTSALSQSSTTTTLASQVDANRSEVLNLIATKVTPTDAQAIAVNAIHSTFGTDASAFVGGIASTYVDANSAIAKDVNLLSATLNGVSGSVSDISLLTIETVPNPLWVDNGFLLDPDSLGNPRYITRAKATKQLQVDANGVISGILLESGSTSSVTIQADQFKLVATGQSVASINPFTVNATTGQITFNGVVDFTSTNTSGTTTIDGAKITTGSISAAQISATAISGKTITGGTITGTVINGSTINGANIIGSIIKASWIDYTSVGILTDWAYFTAASVPADCVANFAHNADGSLSIDSNGYARLPTVSTPTTKYKSFEASLVIFSSYVPPSSVPALYSELYSYNSFRISSTNRIIKISPVFIVLDISTPILSFTTIKDVSTQISTSIKIGSQTLSISANSDGSAWYSVSVAIDGVSIGNVYGGLTYITLSGFNLRIDVGVSSSSPYPPTLLIFFVNTYNTYSGAAWVPEDSQDFFVVGPTTINGAYGSISIHLPVLRESL